MSEKSQITKGDVVCLKSEKSKAPLKKFTVGDEDGQDVWVYWFFQGELKNARLPVETLHKIE